MARFLALALAAILVGSPAAAQTVESGRLNVLGRATIERAPDYVSVQVGVLTKAATPTAALDENSAAAARIIAFAKTFGVHGRDLRTAAVSLSPVTKTVRDPNGDTRQEPDGYQAINTVQVRLRDIARLGAFMRDVLNQGANRINGVQFGLSEPDKAADAARTAAFEDGLRKATLLAAAAKAKLGRLQQITHPPRVEVRSPLDGPAAMLRTVAEMDVPIEAGAVEVSAEVDMTWVLE